jgi:hypothetical protein
LYYRKEKETPILPYHCKESYCKIFNCDVKKTRFKTERGTMAGNSIAQDAMGGLSGAAAGFLIGGPLGAGIGFAAGAGLSAVAQNNVPTPNLQSPDTLSSTPTLAQTNTTALQMELAKEQSVVPTSSYLGITGGLLDQPHTTGTTLLGS